MLDELAELISERTGLPLAQARMAAELAVNFIKDKLPEPLASQLDLAIRGDAAMDMLERGLGNLGGLLGKD